MKHIAREPVTDSEIQRFRKFLRIVGRAIAGELKSDSICCGITTAQCHTLLELDERGEATVTELADFFSLDRSTLSRTVDGLVSGGFVNRIENPRDRRYSLLSLTDRGMKEVSRIHTLCNSDYRRLFDRIPVEKRAMVMEAAEILSEAMHNTVGYGQPCCTGGENE